MQTDFFGALVGDARKSETLSIFLLPFCDFVREARKKEYDTCRSNFRLAYNYFKFILLAFSHFFNQSNPYHVEDKLSTASGRVISYVFSVGQEFCNGTYLAKMA